MSVPYPNQELMTISTAIAKIQQRKIERLFTSAATSLASALFRSLTLDLSYSWNKINA